MRFNLKINKIRHFNLVIKNLFLIFFCFLAFASFSQNFKGGINAGLCATQVDGDTYSGYNKAGFMGGGYTQYFFKENMYGQLNLQYVQKGSRKPINPDKGDYTFYKLSLNYLEIPVSFNYIFKRFHFGGGLYYGALVKIKEEDMYGELHNLYKNNNFHLYDIGGLAQISYPLFKKVYMTWRYSYSFFPIRLNHNMGYNPYINRGQYNNVLIFSFSYLFGKTDEKK